MPTPNSEIAVNKIDFSLAHLTSGAGLLEPEDALRFIRILIKRAVLMPLVTVTPMKAPQKKVDKLRFSGEVLKPGTTGQALSEGDRSAPDLSNVTLDAKLLKAEINIDDEVLEDSIEQDNLKDTVMQEFSKAASRDFENLMINGDTSLSGLLGVFDGILAQATSNTVVAGGITLGKDTLRDMLKLMPSEFLAARQMMRFLTSVDAEIDYRDSIANRSDAAGVRALGADATTAPTVAYAGVEVMPVPLFPEDLGGGNETEALLLDTENIQVGVHREMKLETDRDVRAGSHIVVLSMRADTKYTEETAVVKATGITVSA